MAEVCPVHMATAGACTCARARMRARVRLGLIEDFWHALPVYHVWSGLGGCW